MKKRKKIEKEKKHDRMERAGIQSSIEKNGERTGWLGFPEKFHARTRKINRNVPVRDPRSADAGMRILDMVGVRFHGFESRKIHAWSWYTAHAPSTIASCLILVEISGVKPFFSSSSFAFKRGNARILWNHRGSWGGLCPNPKRYPRLPRFFEKFSSKF